MISICIPVYNNNVTTLVQYLQNQCDKLDISYEILLQDDGTRDREIVKANKSLSNERVIYESNKKNKGRSFTRNKLVARSTGRWLIFLDNDKHIKNHDFVATYLERKKENEVLYGGVEYKLEQPLRSHRIRWYYGRNIESISREGPIAPGHFSTCNFMAPKQLFKHVMFSTELKGYGFEDVLFAKEAQTRGFDIIQIKNPVLTVDKVSNKVFLENTREALENLSFLYTQQRLTANDGIRLLETKERIESLRLDGFFAFISILFSKSLEAILRKGVRSVRLFSLYKLLLFYRVLQRR